MEHVRLSALGLLQVIVVHMVHMVIKQHLKSFWKKCLGSSTTERPWRWFPERMDERECGEANGDPAPRQRIGFELWSMVPAAG